MRQEGSNSLPKKQGLFFRLKSVKLLSFLISFAVIFVCFLAFGAYNITLATTYYIDATGGNDDNTGTSLSTPFATLQKAHDVANTGDTIYIRGGTYNFSTQTNITKSGADGSPINIFAYPGEKPIIDGINLPSGTYIIRLNNASWWYIKGLEIENGTEGGIYIIGTSSNNIIENNNVHHNGRLSQWEGKGIVLYGSGSNNQFINNDSHHNRNISGENADGLQIATTGSGTILQGNRVWRNSDDGYDLFNSIDNSTGGTFTLESNWAWENGFDDDLQSLGNGDGFKLGSQRSNTTSTSGGHLLKNNLSWNNKMCGFDENTSTRPNTF